MAYVWLKMRELGLYVLFLILLTVRFVADLQRFPCDGYSPAGVSAVDVIEYLTFYSSVYIVFSLALLSRKRLSLFAHGLGLAATTLYMFVHFLELFFPAGGRAAHYAAADHFLINFVTGFTATGDIALWQFLRLPLCGAFLYVAQRWSGLSVVTSFLRLAGIYIFFMLYVHPDVWAFNPRETAVDEMRIFEAGVQNLLICAYVTAALSVVCSLCLKKNNEPRHRRDLVYALLMMPAPTFVACYTATELWLVVVTSLVLRERLRQLLLGPRGDGPVFVKLAAGHIFLLTASILWFGVEAGPWLSLIVLLGTVLETLTDRWANGRPHRRPAGLVPLAATVGFSYWSLIF